MSAKELLRQFKSLSAGEKEKFLVAASRAPVAGQRAHSSKRVQWPDVEARARRVSDNQRLPNLVLLEREESSH